MEKNEHIFWEYPVMFEVSPIEVVYYPYVYNKTYIKTRYEFFERLVDIIDWMLMYVDGTRFNYYDSLWLIKHILIYNDDISKWVEYCKINDCKVSCIFVEREMNTSSVQYPRNSIYIGFTDNSSQKIYFNRFRKIPLPFVIDENELKFISTVAFNASDTREFRPYYYKHKEEPKWDNVIRAMF